MFITRDDVRQTFGYLFNTEIYTADTKAMSHHKFDWPSQPAKNKKELFEKSSPSYLKTQSPTLTPPPSQPKTKKSTKKAKTPKQSLTGGKGNLHS